MKLNQILTSAFAIVILATASTGAFAGEKAKHGHKKAEAVQAKCEKAFGTDEAKIKKCVEAKGDVSKVN